MSDLWSKRETGAGAGRLGPRGDVPKLIALVTISAAIGVGAGQGEAHWAFRPVTSPEPPAVKSVELVQSPVDQFILAKLEEHGLGPAAPADRPTLIRRATYDLTGLPPTPAEVDAFVSDESPLAFPRVVDRLLASPRYGEHWGRHWLDLARYADTAGENTDHPLPHAWRYRNWVIQSFNDDLPYDEFVREQIAGDLLAASGAPDRFSARTIATGYLALARRFGSDFNTDMHLTMEDTIDTLGKSILGLTLGCARCHDHKYDPVTMRDYYGLYGIFASTRFAFPGSELKQQPRDLVPVLSPAEIATLRRPFEEKLAALDIAVSGLNDAQTNTRTKLKDLAARSARLLARGEFNDGGSQSLSTNGVLIEVRVQAGEMIQLAVHPRANHGADSTLVELDLTEVDGNGGRWDVTQDVVGDLPAGNPHADRAGHLATWCFLDLRNGPQLLPECVRDADGRKGLHVWRNGDTPSAFVNATDQPIKAWTTLPPRSFFVHPAADGPVGVAWLSPISGTVRINGRVADAHPGGPDGVSWTLEHFAGDFAAGLNELSGLAMRIREPMQQRRELKSREPLVPVAYAVGEGTARNARVQKRGDPEQAGDEVPRKFPDFLGGQRVEATGHSGRLELARWLTDPSNPLTARVMVNRIWQWHFGRGLVATPNDFGRRGQPPSHPELLDWLASEFVRSGWSVKAMHRLVMLSGVYQQASVARDRDVAEGPEDKKTGNQEDKSRGSSSLPVLVSSAVAAAPSDRDPNHSLLSHFPRRRLTAEELRDTLLAVSGELDLTVGGPHPFPPEEKWNFTQHGPFADNYETLKRAVYVMQKRNRRTPFFALFDGADPNACTAVREVTTVPTQALYFMNDPFFHARAARFGARILSSSANDRTRLEFACRELFSRGATKEDHADLEAFLKDYRAMDSVGTPAEQKARAWLAYARVLLGGNELLHVD